MSLQVWKLRTSSTLKRTARDKEGSLLKTRRSTHPQPLSNNNRARLTASSKDTRRTARPPRRRHPTTLRRVRQHATHCWCHGSCCSSRRLLLVVMSRRWLHWYLPSRTVAPLSAPASFSGVATSSSVWSATSWPVSMIAYCSAGAASDLKCPNLALHGLYGLVGIRTGKLTSVQLTHINLSSTTNLRLSSN